MTTGAVSQKSAPRDSAPGASGLVLSSPRSPKAPIWIRECRTMVDLSFISLLAARFLGTDDADEVFALPAEHNSLHLSIEPHRAQLSPAVVFPVVGPSHDLVGKDC